MGGGPHQPHPGARIRCCGCSLPGLTGFTTYRRGGTDAGHRRSAAFYRSAGPASKAATQKKFGPQKRPEQRLRPDCYFSKVRGRRNGFCGARLGPPVLRTFAGVHERAPSQVSCKDNMPSARGNRCQRASEISVRFSPTASPPGGCRFAKPGISAGESAWRIRCSRRAEERDGYPEVRGTAQSRRAQARTNAKPKMMRSNGAPSRTNSGTGSREGQLEVDVTGPTGVKHIPRWPLNRWFLPAVGALKRRR